MNWISTIRAGATIAGFSAFAFVAFVTLSPIELRPVVAGLQTEHFEAFAVIGGLLGLAYPRRLLPVLLFVVLAATGLEIAQNFVPGRHGRVVDLAFKLFGGVCGIGAAALLNAFFYSARGQALLGGNAVERAGR